MKRPVRWLHISDILTDARERPQPPEQLFLEIIKHVVQAKSHNFVPDLLFVTGDVSFSADPKEFRRFSEQLLVPLQYVIGNGCERRTFIVPGNHDVTLSTRSGFDAGILLGRASAFFGLGDAGRNERQMLLPRFQAFRGVGRADWLDSSGGCGIEQVSLGTTTVGVVLTNTAWLSTGGDDSGRLTPGAMLVEAALHSIQDTDYRFVLGHHPLEALQPEESFILSELLRKNKAIYLCGGGSKVPASFRPTQSALSVAGFPLHNRETPHRNVAGIIWGEVDADEVRLRPQHLVPDVTQWLDGGPGYSEEFKKEQPGGGSWWPIVMPGSNSGVSQRPFHVPIYATRYTRRTKNDRVVFEHAQRAGDQDIGEDGLRRGPMLVDEAIAFFSRVLLLGPDGSGKSFTLNRLYEILARAYKSNDPLLIREAYPDWRHAPLPVPIRLKAPAVIEWLSASDGSATPREKVTDPPLLRYVTANLRQCCPEADFRTLKAHCYRESLVLLVDEWEMLGPDAAARLDREIAQFTDNTRLETRHLPAVVYAATVDSAGYISPARSNEPAIERISIAALDNEAQERFIAEFCRAHGRERVEFPEFPDHLRKFVTTPAAMIALLLDWQREKFRKSLKFPWDLAGLYAGRLKQALYPRSNGMDSLRPLAIALLDQFRQTPSKRRLEFVAPIPLPRALEDGPFLKRNSSDHCFIPDVLLQDYIIGWALDLTSKQDLDVAFTRLLDQSGLRREPIKFALLWMSAAGSEGRLIEAMTVLLSRPDDAVATAAAAEFINEVQWKPPSRELIALARQRFSECLWTLQASSLDRYLISRALAVCGDARSGVAQDNTRSLPDIDWVKIPRGTVWLGQTPKDRKLYNSVGVPPNDEGELTKASVERIWLSRYPVTGSQFDLFLRDQIYGYESDFPWQGLQRPEKPRSVSGALPNVPVTSVSWDEAKAFCRWYSKITGCDVDLPTYVEWEYAARGPESDRVFPFGDAAESGSVNSQEEGLPGAIAVGAFPKVSPFGVADMCGNVFEWCSDALHPDVEDLEDFKITKGGSYNHDLQRCRNATRGKKHRSSQHPYLGFRLAKRAEPAVRPRVVIVGSGFSGTCTAIRLLALEDRPLEIVMVEDKPARSFGGLAYSPATTHWEHLFNLQAGRISLYREDRDDLVKFLDAEINPLLDKEGRERLAGIRFEKSTEVSRLLYHLYLKHRLRKAARESHPQVTLRLIESNAIAVSEDPRAVVIRTESEEEITLPCSQVILCTGNLQIRRPDFLKPVLANKERYFEDQYCEEARRALKNLRAEQKVLVLGSALRGYDVVMTMRSDLSDNRSEGKAYLVSRSGRTHFHYALDHMHAVLQLDCPDFLKQPGKLSRSDFVQLTQEAYEAALRNPEVLQVLPKELKSERILKAWERYVPQALKRLNGDDVRALLEEYKSLITVKRIGVVPRIGKSLEQATPEHCEIKAWTVTEIIPTPGGFWVHHRDTITKKEDDTFFHVIINCMGREQNYENLDDKLWRTLLKSGAARRQQLTGIGVDVDANGMLVSAAGRPSEWIACVGVMREGDEFERHGRLGSFSFTLGPLKNQALDAAVSVRRRLAGRPAPVEGLDPPKRDWSDLGQIVGECAARAGSLTKLNFPRGQAPFAESAGWIWQLALDRLTARSYSKRESLAPTIRKFEDLIADTLASYSVADRNRQVEFTASFAECLEDLALAHLTRLDEVEPGETYRKLHDAQAPSEYIRSSPVTLEEARAAASDYTGQDSSPRIVPVKARSHVFISYLRKDRESVDKLVAALESNGIDVWIDREDINPGEIWRDAIEGNGITGSYAAIACITRSFETHLHSPMQGELRNLLGHSSYWTANNDFVIPVLLEPCKLPDTEIGKELAKKQSIQLISASEWDRGIRKLLDRLAILRQTYGS